MLASTRRARGFTLLEVLLVLGIIALFIVCIAGYFMSRGIEPLKPPPRKIPAAKTTPAPATPVPAVAPPGPAAPPAEPAP